MTTQDTRDLGDGWTQPKGGECEHPDWEVARRLDWGGAIWRHKPTGKEVGTGNPRGCHPPAVPE